MNSVKITPKYSFYTLLFLFIFGCDSIYKYETKELQRTSEDFFLPKNDGDSLLVRNFKLERLKNSAEKKEFVVVQFEDRFLSSENGSKAISCSRGNIGLWEIFKISSLDNKSFFLMASNQKFMSLQEDGSLQCTSEEQNERSKFYLREVEDRAFVMYGPENRYCFIDNNIAQLLSNRNDSTHPSILKIYSIVQED